MEAYLEKKLQERGRLTEQLHDEPFKIHAYWNRANVYADLGYPDLAAMDYYKVILLVDEIADESGEFHKDALESLRSHIAAECSTTEDLIDDAQVIEYAELNFHESPHLQLVNNLLLIGCLRSAYNYIRLALRTDPSSEKANEALSELKARAKFHFGALEVSFDPENFEADVLPDKGYVRREVYPWNSHDSDRTSQDAIAFLNSAIHPKLEVKVTELPMLYPVKANQSSEQGQVELVRQLGVFAKTDIAPGEEILRERSLLTANNRMQDSICDACSAPLPELGSNSVESPSCTYASDEALGSDAKSLTPCPDCDDTVFCSRTCYNLAAAKYHPALCGMDVDSIAKETPAAESADSLYTLLLMRALAIAVTEEKHALDIFEVKYIWGDFVQPPSVIVIDDPKVDSASSHKEENARSIGTKLFSMSKRTLPFTFLANILGPLHMLEKMDIGPFTAPQGLAEAWVYNTLYAKFRGTASARLDKRTGRPEVAAVHPIWCLANHSCDPNVMWEWAGEIRFFSRGERKTWTRTGSDGNTEIKSAEKEKIIRENDEILNHYVDIDLPVQDRREWGVGPLGGLCMCQRCIWESTTI